MGESLLTVVPRRAVVSRLAASAMESSGFARAASGGRDGDAIEGDASSRGRVELRCPRRPDWWGQRRRTASTAWPRGNDGLRPVGHSA